MARLPRGDDPAFAVFGVTRDIGTGNYLVRVRQGGGASPALHDGARAGNRIADGEGRVAAVERENAGLPPIERVWKGYAPKKSDLAQLAATRRR